MAEADWAWWPDRREPVRVLTHDELWGQALVDVLSPAERRAFRVDPDALRPLADRCWTDDELQWRAAALRAMALAMAGEPLAVRGGRVRLLPHQLSTLARALEMNPVRLGVCDEVGLGKTITAGAIASELRARRRATRVLVVAPKGVQLQWVAEMRDRFAEDYIRVGPEGVPINADVWRAFDRVVTSIDVVKPLRTRVGWTADQVRQYNDSRFFALVGAGWDLVILDEAHHVAGSDDSVARHRLARELAASSHHLLLLSATPHSGKSDSFRRFLGLLDPTFFAGSPVTRDSVTRLVARTDKRSAVDDDGHPLFQPRTTHLEPVPWGDHVQHRVLYEEVTDYVRDGYVNARATGRTATGFLMLLLQRLLASSTPAILSALERRLTALTDALAPTPRIQLDFEDWEELTGEEQDAALERDVQSVVTDEVTRLTRLVDRARVCHSLGPDPKTLHFLQLLRRLRREENDPRVKVLVFTEFRATQRMLMDLLEGQGISATLVNGDMGLEERAVAQQLFRDEADVLVSTDAGGEGINLQFAHVVVNWDLPWAPTRIEQRIGRVDRIGQHRPVRAFNLVLEDSVDLRVLDVLEGKLRTIEEELGADKRADILDSADRLVDEVFTQAIVDPAGLTSAANDFDRRVREDLTATDAARRLMKPTTKIVLKQQEAQLPRVLASAASALAALNGSAVADPTEALRSLPVVAPGEPVPVVSAEVEGWLSVWLVSPSDSTDQSGAYAVFRGSTGRVDPHHAERVWRKISTHPSIVASVIPDESTWRAIVDQGRDFGHAPLQQLACGRGDAPRIELALLVRAVP